MSNVQVRRLVRCRRGGQLFSGIRRGPVLAFYTERERETPESKYVPSQVPTTSTRYYSRYAHHAMLSPLLARFAVPVHRADCTVSKQHGGLRASASQCHPPRTVPSHLRGTYPEHSRVPRATDAALLSGFEGDRRDRRGSDLRVVMARFTARSGLRGPLLSVTFQHLICIEPTWRRSE